MRSRTAAAIAGAAATAVVVLVLLLVLSSGGSETTRGPGGAAAGGSTPSAPPTSHPRGKLVGCSARSWASFPGAFADPRNLVVGPLVLVGGAHTPASTVREYGGNKFPLLVSAGHAVTVQVPRGAGLFYGRGGEAGKIRLGDAEGTINFVACRPNQESGSAADGSVTFWAGFVLTRAPACIPLRVSVDDESAPRRVGLPLGRRCPDAPAGSATRGSPGDTHPRLAVTVACEGITPRPGWRREVTSVRGFGLFVKHLAAQGTELSNGDYLVKAGAAVVGDEPVTLRVPAALRGIVGLDYGGEGGHRRPSEAETQVTFRPCGDRPRSGYVGGLVFRGAPREVVLDVLSEGETERLTLRR